MMVVDGGDGVEDAGFDAEFDQLVNSSVCLTLKI